MFCSYVQTRIQLLSLMTVFMTGSFAGSVLIEIHSLSYCIFETATNLSRGEPMDESVIFSHTFPILHNSSSINYTHIYEAFFYKQHKHIFLGICTLYGHKLAIFWFKKGEVQLRNTLHILNNQLLSKRDTIFFIKFMTLLGAKSVMKMYSYYPNLHNKFPPPPCESRLKNFSQFSEKNFFHNFQKKNFFKFSRKTIFFKFYSR